MQSQIEQILKNYQDPYLQQDLITAKIVKNIQIDGNNVKIEMIFPYPVAGTIAQISQQILAKISAEFPASQVSLQINSNIGTSAVHGGLKPLHGVKNIIAIASGKGGVGKSTTAVNLALALKAEGARVGLLDADIYGPNQPQMLGVNATPETKDGKTLQPLLAHGLQTMSIGYLIEAGTAMVWRGPMATGALMQLLNDTEWHDLDYLIIDLPPGTGDIQLTMAQKIPVTGVVMVTTPQEIALSDVRKGIAMFQKVNVPLLGVIENMSTHRCSQCDHEEAIFGSGGGVRLQEEFQLPLLGSLPLAKKIREQADGGTPIVLAEPNGSIAQNYREIARKVAGAVAKQAKSYAHKFPTIVIEK